MVQEQEVISLRRKIVSHAKRQLLISILFGLGISLVLFPIIGGLIIFTLTMLPSALATFTGKDQKDNVTRIILAAKSYKVTYTHYPETIDQVLSTKLLPASLVKQLMDPLTKGKYFYQGTREGKDCTALTILPDKSIYTLECE